MSSPTEFLVHRYQLDDDPDEDVEDDDDFDEDDEDGDEEEEGDEDVETWQVSRIDTFR